MLHTHFRSTGKATAIIAGFSYIFLALVPHNAQAAGGDSSRMVVILKSTAVERWLPRSTETVANLFPDQRAHANPRLWNAVSLKTASLIRSLETKIAARAFMAFGNRTHGFAAYLNPQQIAALKADPNVEAVFEDIQGQLASAAPAPWVNTPTVQFSTSTTASPTIYTKGWNLKAINLYNSNINTDTPAYRTNGGYPVDTYIIDGAVQPHFDLNYTPSTDHISFDCHDNVGGNCTQANPTPSLPSQQYTNQCDSHGTYVAGAVGAMRESGSPVGIEGVAPGAHIVSVRVTNACKASQGQLLSYAYTSGVLAAINWIAGRVPNNGVDAQGRRRLSAVANMSIVWALIQQPVRPGQTPPPYNPQLRYVLPEGAKTALTNAISAAVQKGVFFTFAAGNSNEPACNIYPGAISKDLAGAMSVGAIQSDGKPMDTRGSTDDAALSIASSGPCVEVWAPGRDVEGAVAYVGSEINSKKEDNPWGFLLPTNSYGAGQHYYARHTGSSIAAPHVAGAALLIARKYQMAGLPLPSPADIETQIKSRTKFLGYWDPLGWFPIAADKRINALTVDRF